VNFFGRQGEFLQEYIRISKNFNAAWQENRRNMSGKQLREQVLK
jgi:hypothetical protein